MALRPDDAGVRQCKYVGSSPAFGTGSAALGGRAGAAVFGGGGHPGASGLKIPFEYQKELIEKTFSSTLYIDEKTQY